VGAAAVGTGVGRMASKVTNQSEIEREGESIAEKAETGGKRKELLNRGKPKCFSNNQIEKTCHQGVTRGFGGAQ